MSKDRLDKVFSIYVRRRDVDKGCISCGQALRFDYCDAGHYIPRTHTATRWNVYNVNAQCYTCNRLLDGNIAAYRQGLIKRYGIEVVERLEKLKHTTVKVSNRDIKQLIKRINHVLDK